MNESFSQEAWDALLKQSIAQIKSLATIKGGEYAGDVDRLANFRRNGAALSLSMELIWSVYASKHWDAIQQYIKDLTAGKERQRAEPIQGRADDLIVYLLLLKAMCQEREKAVLDLDRHQSYSSGKRTRLDKSINSNLVEYKCSYCGAWVAEGPMFAAHIERHLI